MSSFSPDSLNKIFIGAWITIFLTGVTIGSYGQGSIGVGVARIQFDSATVIDFYNQPGDKDYYKRIEFFNDRAISSWSIKNLDDQRTWLNPEILWLDYFQFAFRCKTKTDHWLEVVVDSKTGRTCWIKLNKATVFVTWENYLKDMFSITRLEHEKQPIRTSPSDNSKEIEYKGTDCFQLKKLEGDWIEIFTPDRCEANGSNVKITSGWIRWRQGNKLLIRYYTTS